MFLKLVFYSNLIHYFIWKIFLSLNKCMSLIYVWRKKLPFLLNFLKYKFFETNAKALKFSQLSGFLFETESRCFLFFYIVNHNAYIYVIIYIYIYIYIYIILKILQFQIATINWILQYVCSISLSFSLSLSLWKILKNLLTMLNVALWGIVSL